MPPAPMRIAEMPLVAPLLRRASPSTVAIGKQREGADVGDVVAKRNAVRRIDGLGRHVRAVVPAGVRPERVEFVEDI